MLTPISELCQDYSSDYTPMIATRNYRPPEVSLKQNYYKPAMDVFSVGCVIFELLQTLQPTKNKTIHIESLFKSKSDILVENWKENYRSKLHLINSPKEHISEIINILGTPDEDDIDFISDNTLKIVLFNIFSI